LVLAGAALAMIGSWGLLRLDGFYNRIHPPTMGTTMGVALVLAASAVLFTALESRPVVHEAAIAVFMIVTTPVTFMLLVRGALRRDRALAGNRDGTPAPRLPDDAGAASAPADGR
ncbi:MAG: monovalent cation/H(+) antiporter subunit G, partial [Burkholderiales bacterium]|nr:monovalent cation/H(+) antiporter subunit G [Burkholderiales bacterium]